MANPLSPDDFFARLDSSAPPALAAAARALRELALASGPMTQEEVKYGGVLFAGRQGFCGIFAYAAHVTLEFSEGARLEDPGAVLQGKGKGRRHLKFTAPRPQDLALAAEFIAKARALADQ